MKKKQISLFLTIGIIGFLGFYLYQNRNMFVEIEKIKPLYTIPVVIIVFFNLYINGYFLKTLTIPFNIKLKEHFLISIASTFLNTITPFRGGAGFRAFYMKKKYKLNYTYFLSSLAGNYIISFLTTSTTALAITLFYYLKTSQINLPVLFFFLAISISTTILLLFPIKIKPTNFITTHLSKMLQGWEIIKQHSKIIPLLVVMVIVSLFSTSLMNVIVFSSLSFEISYLNALYFSSLGILTGFISITPGALGVTEGVYMIIGTIIGVPPGISLLVAIIIRGISTTIFLTAGPIANGILIKKLKDNS